VTNEEIITSNIIQAIEKGSAKFVMPWHRTSYPVNGVTRKPYRGINAIALWAAAEEEGFHSPEWATYKSWSDAGQQVRKGQRGTKITYFQFLEPKEGEDPDRKKGFRRFYSVFNADQLDSAEEVPVVRCKPSHSQASISVRQIADNVGADVRCDTDKAFYHPIGDYVNMPAIDKFINTAELGSADMAYACVLAHELIHWTGHPSRLDRSISTNKKSAEYAFEELIAELGSAFVASEIGLDYNGIDGHAGYIKSWLTLLKHDSRAIFRASSQAMAAKRFLIPEEEVVVP